MEVLMETILVVWNHSGHNINVLHKAAGLLKKMDQKAVVVTFINDLTDETTVNSNQIADIENEVYEIIGKSLISEFLFARGDKADWIVDYCEANNIGLVLKPWDRTSSKFFTNTDWQLIRHLNTDLLLAKSEKWHGYRKVLAAINIKSSESSSQNINKLVLNKANYWESGDNSELHVVYCIPMNPATLSLDIKSPVEKEHEFKASCQREIDGLLAENSLFANKVHVFAGTPEQVISNVANSEKVDLIVIGSRGKRGIGTIISGNTSERILKHLRSDILVVRQPD